MLLGRLCIDGGGLHHIIVITAFASVLQPTLVQAKVSGKCHYYLVHARVVCHACFVL